MTIERYRCVDCGKENGCHTVKGLTEGEGNREEWWVECQTCLFTTRAFLRKKDAISNYERFLKAMKVGE